MTETLAKRWPSLPYVLPFASFMVFLALQNYVSLPPRIDYPLRIVVLSVILFVFSRHVIDLRSTHRLESVLLGIGVFVIWVGPDILIPGYRQHWLFQNSALGRIGGTVPEELLTSPMVLWARILRAVVLVPIIEELFWRAWLMRWLISPRFEQIKLGAYAPMAFWITALLFASEHGPYWDVGLITGVIYNWWMIRTRSLGDCILVHAVTNACLCGYVVATKHWEYWL
ncbi:MAG TPA: CAAX prenyl protease-related protein [Bryobacteraceae bacterium]|nr:CAAX prenyl protease-related protein [Bryobacteraceae bacterium]